MSPRAFGTGAAALVAMGAIEAIGARDARAEPGDERVLVGTQVALGGGARFAPTGAIDAALARAGWPAVATITPDTRLRFGITFYDVGLDVHFSGIDRDLTAPEGRSAEYHRVDIGADLGTRLRLTRGLHLAPFVGLNGVKTTLCFAGAAGAKSSRAMSVFSQVAANPGVGACIADTTTALDLGFSVPWTVFSSQPEAIDGIAMTHRITIGPKFAATIDLAHGDTWSTSESPTFPTQLPAFKGPTAPVAGGYIGIEAQYVFGLARASRSAR